VVAVSLLCFYIMQKESQIIYKQLEVTDLNKALFIDTEI
jgi:hypothetical protein